MPANTATPVPPTPAPDLPAPVAREPKAHRDNIVPVTFEWDYPAGELPPGYEFAVILQGPNGQEYRPAACDRVRTMPCVVPPPPPGGNGPYEWWLVITRDGASIGIESNHLTFPWDVPPEETSPPASQPTAEPATPEPAPPSPQPTKQPPPTPIP
ncbi:MAG: hypothetical protein M5U01_32880 [Ardenticatenaceae bacterium]|nr:hypothetical protein [Ardenticatenaceae bacterium]